MQSPKNRVIVACAGSRKTTSLVEAALGLHDGRVLITTYTNENVDQIVSRLIEHNGCVPPNVTVLSWFSFLLQEGVRPYQNFLVAADRVESIDFTTKPNRYVARADADRFYLNTRQDVYRDRVSDFACQCDQRSGGLVVKRLEKIYQSIFVDELQDFAGYDLDLLEILLKSKIGVFAVGDPRQATFATNNASRNKQYKKSHVVEWIAKMERANLLAREEWVTCYRSNQAICDFADALYPHMPKSISKNEAVTGHDGIFHLKREEAIKYYEQHSPMVLRWNKTSDTLGLTASNFGAMKGRTFPRVLIFPTDPMKRYFATKDPSVAGDLSKFYVAVTRAQHSVAFVV
jgi:hypothetical protein